MELMRRMMMSAGRWSRNAALAVGVVALLMTVSACDSDEDLTDAELVVGAWDLSALSDGNGDQIATFNQNYTSFTGTFETNGDVAIDLISADADPDVNITGTYTVDEALGSIGITTSVGGTLVTLPFTYSFTNDDTLVLNTSALLLSQVLQTSLTGSASVTLSRK